MHPADLPTEILLQHCRTTPTRRSGPGGQNRNKVQTAIVLEHLPTGIRAQASERRSQAQNLSQALFRLRIQLALSVRTPRTTLSDRWKNRLASERLSINPAHDDFPAILAEALDHIVQHNHDLPAAAGTLGVSTSQLVKILRLEPQALQQVNAHRLATGLHPLH
jgi:hypothetical protein